MQPAVVYFLCSLHLKVLLSTQIR